MIQDNLFLDMINSPVRDIKARVELYNGSTLLNTFSYRDKLKSFTIERVGIGKFFGFGVCQKLNLKLIDKERELTLTTDNTFNVAFGVGSDYIYNFPLFKITEVNRDERTNELSITAYDALNGAYSHFFRDLGIIPPYSIKTVLAAIGGVLGLPINYSDANFELNYENGANFDGSENLREVLDAIAEATQTIYFINANWELTFKSLGAAVDFTIDRNKYFELDSKTNRRLGTITHTTELGDNLSASIDASGSTQYIRNNPFIELRDDAAAILDAAIDKVGGLTLNQFNCKWRGNFLLEIGDKIALETKDNETVYSYLLDDVINYDGTLSQESQWQYEENEEETESTPTNLGDALKQTFARVDKANKQIELVVSSTEENSANISNLLINTDAISASVESIEKNITDSFDATNQQIEEISKKASAAMSAEDVQIAITTEIANGINTVETTTGYKFNEDGLNISKTDSEISTQITEDGMIVSRNDDVVLTADNEGVKAEDLHATTYLIIGNSSRFEDYEDASGNTRTGCFWIGG